MELPLLLAGPILRRVDPTLVAVRVALSKPATVTLASEVWSAHRKSVGRGEGSSGLRFDTLRE